MTVKVYCDCCGTEGAERLYCNFSHDASKVSWGQNDRDLCTECAIKLKSAIELVLGPTPKPTR